MDMLEAKKFYTIRAATFKPADSIDTSCSIEARWTAALIRVDLTVYSFEACKQPAVAWWLNGK